MTVIARFSYSIQSGRMDEFRAKLKAAADPRFNSAQMPQAIRFYRSIVPGAALDTLVMDIEYPSVEAWGARTDFEHSHAAWAKIWGAQPDAPERLLSVELLRQVDPFA
ncbi:MAG: hypothetical protein ABIU96_15610 [Rhodanobacter sp.]